ncbi:UNVERIFIED_CONTAM: hypothetical protein Slati_2223000 [Sesamum latifolium]|uniref:Retrotransposon gag domain-containing protein n=1 Tax=Sesamum latifolium TaxID=2727402 RepID=A0AAW2WTZ1_9LAMI
MGAIGSFQEFRSLFLHQFASSRKLRKTELSLFAIRQKDNESLKEYLQRFNIAALEVPSATQEVKVSAFSRGLLDGDFFKSLAKKPVSKFDALLVRAAKYINMEDAQATKKEPWGKEKGDEEGEYVCWEKARGTGPYQKNEIDKPKEAKNASPKTLPKGGPKLGTGDRTELDDPPRKGVIRMIAGDPVGGDSHHARKAEVRKAYDETIREILDVEAADDTPINQFGRVEHSGPKNSHNDALVITALLANYGVGRIFIDSGSSVDILFGEAYDQIFKCRHTRRTCMLKFLVVDVPSAYNAILGRPTLNNFQAVISMYHMKIKFSTPGGVGEVQGDPLQSRKYYIEAVRKGQKRSSNEIPK